MSIFFKFFSLFIALNFFALLSLTACAKHDQIIRDDCGVSFVTPKELTYIEIENPQLSKSVSCVIAFKIKDAQSEIYSAGQSEGWREQIDYVLEVRRSTFEAALADYSLNADINNNYKLDESKNDKNTIKLRLVSAATFEVKNGTGLIADLEVINRPTSMIERGVKGQIVFIAGNKILSTSYALWPSSKDEYSRNELNIMTSLFKSIDILEK